MNLKRTFLVVVGLGILLNSSAQTSERYIVAEPGTLAKMLTGEEASEITYFVLQGKLNAIDLRRSWGEFKKLQILGIPNAFISMYAGKNGTYPDRSYIYPANCIPSYASCKQINDSVFAGKTSLTQAILSDRVKNIEDDVFKGCTSLRICQIRKGTPSNLLPGALADSMTAVFVPLGGSDAYRNGERWEIFAFMEGEPVGVTVQIAAMGSLVSEPIHAGIQPKDVNPLMVEGKMDEAGFTLICNHMPNLVGVDLSWYDTAVIPDYTFMQKKYLLNVKLLHDLESMGRCAFSGCGCLCGTLVLSSGVTTMEYGAFMGCDNLRHVLVTGNKVITLGDNLLGSDKDKPIYRDQ